MPGDLSNEKMPIIETNTRPQRLLSLDILRGITIAGMILVNNPGSWTSIYAPLRHAEWNGLTPTDLVFPFFMFVMGVSAWLSLQKSGFKLTRQLAWKVVRRSVLLFLIGWAVQWLSHLCASLAAGESLLTALSGPDHLRWLGVLQRLGICYCAAALLSCLLRPRQLAWTAAAMLTVYALMLLLGHGYDISLDNIIYRIDNALLTPEHMYHEECWLALSDELTLTAGYGSAQAAMQPAFDPEGLGSTLPAIAHVIIGMLFGRLITTHTDNLQRVRLMLTAGTAMMATAWLASYALPLNKALWSPTYTLMTCGMAATLLALLIVVIDINHHQSWCRFFQSFGVNPLFMYVMGSVFSILFSYITLPVGPDGSATIHSVIHRCLWQQLLPDGSACAASCLYAITFVAIIWCLGYTLYKKKIYIKL